MLLTSFDPSVLVIAKRAPPRPADGPAHLDALPAAQGDPRRQCTSAARSSRRSSPRSRCPGTPAEAMERELSEVVAFAHRAGLEVVAWCPKPPEEALLARAGVDCIIVDDVLSR